MFRHHSACLLLAKRTLIVYFFSMMKFTDFVSKIGGDAELADRLGVKPRTVQSWRLGDRQPRPVLAQKIIKISDGDLSWDDIYYPTRVA